MSLLALLTYGGLRSLLVPAPEFRARSGGGVRGIARRILCTGFAFGGMAGLGLGLAAFQLLPFAELFTFSEGPPGLVAYWYADGTFALTPYVYSQATGNRLVDMQPPAPAAAPAVATFGGWLELYGSAVITQAFDADNGRLDGAFLETDWQLRAPAGHRYTLYVHFTAPDGQIIAQADHALAVWTGRRGDLYTDEWPVGILVRDYVALPPEALGSAFPLDVRVGVWIPETGERLPVASSTLPVDEYGRLILGRLAP